MDIRELTKLDLNLLFSLHILIEEQSVSKAAERLHITQPAMSKTLARLRKTFGDPLFTRSSHGMQPTPRTEALAGDLRRILMDIQSLVSPVQFDPYAFSGEINLALSEYIGVALLPPLIRRLHQLAPRMSIRTITRVENQLEQLALGNLDFAIHIEQAHYGEDFRVEPIGENPPAILIRQDHSLATGLVTWDRLANYPVIQLYISDMEQVEVFQTSESFNRVRHPQQGSLETSHLLTALEVLRSTDYFMPGPAYIMQNSQVTAGIVALPIPEGDDYSMNYMLVSHSRTDNSPLHCWFLENMLAVLGELRASSPNIDA